MSMQRRDEIAFAIQLHEHADFSARVDIAADKPFRGCPLRLLCRGRLPLLSQDVDGAFDIALRFDQR